MKLPTRFTNVVPKTEHTTCNALMIAYNALASDIEAFKKDSERSESDAMILSEYIQTYRAAQIEICHALEASYGGITDEECAREIKELESRREALTNEKCKVIARLNELTD